MILKVVNHAFGYDMKNICTVFFPYEKIREEGEDDIVVITEMRGNDFIVDARVYDKILRKQHTVMQNEDMATAVSVLLYNVLSELMGFEVPWGILFGVRPAKLMHRFAEQYTLQGARNYFINNFLVSPQKTDLAIEVMKHENKIIALSQNKSFSLYVSIPFCPTRCSYCSFVSHSIERTKKLMTPYVELLCEELKKTGEIAKKLDLRLETIYFGGGTPTTLSAKQLTKLFDTIKENFDLSTLREYTVEAGRPDTVTEEKLLALKNAGVGRISINPQSFNDNVLEAIGRKHTAEQTIKAFDLARKCGFDNINMDFIAGLPKDDLDSFKNSITIADDLSAESVTIHTLAIKSASYMSTRDKTFDLTDRLTTSAMVDFSNEFLSGAGYYPYYMYRQSKSLGNLENVGWCKPDKDCLYNVFMMDETHSVFAVGAGAVTRLKNQDTGHIDRIYNYKYPYEYINDFDEIIKRKNGILSFYK
ncbi:MAG: coproporphyrinogen dehydrogenase HemZ [Acetobacter sp.]|nr:coproporphyrinogen dehydrogenase HemZ [Bacteroides sp.]MCM1340683.1 coproporphyrinogen dehydrogenase HemZ [Acetobacter sp.]MCM1433794.1 coproporphyrinogen dehydrogenase HemZ [Clostridiales bacterium]